MSEHHHIPKTPIRGRAAGPLYNVHAGTRPSAPSAAIWVAVRCGPGWGGGLLHSPRCLYRRTSDGDVYAAEQGFAMD